MHHDRGQVSFGILQSASSVTLSNSGSLESSQGGEGWAECSNLELLY